MSESMLADAILLAMIGAAAWIGAAFGRAFERNRCAALCAMEAEKLRAEARAHPSNAVQTELNNQALVAEDLQRDILREMRH